MIPQTQLMVTSTPLHCLMHRSRDGRVSTHAPHCSLLRGLNPGHNSHQSLLECWAGVFFTQSKEAACSHQCSAYILRHGKKPPPDSCLCMYKTTQCHQCIFIRNVRRSKAMSVTTHDSYQLPQLPWLYCSLVCHLPCT